MKLFAKIPEEFVQDEIKWLVIEKDTLGSGGYFLFHHKSLEEPCESDDWFAKKEYAFQAAKEDFGINIDDWKSF